MSKDLIIVESPAKIKTITKFLGPGYRVEASLGHVRDLPPKTLGVDEEHGFAPQYEIIPGKGNVVKKLRAAAKEADTVYLAPDPDREGEAIAWHVAELLRDANTNLKRIWFNEITARAVREALAHPGELRRPLFDSQQARRILDRLVGYKISPLLWSKVRRGLSAGRVQSVALRLIVDRERERQAFTPEEYWDFTLHLATDPAFSAKLWRIAGKKAHVPNEQTAQELRAALEGAPTVVETVQEKERARHPKPPFITSTLQQEASTRLGFSAKRTMSVAQRLYEGVELGERGTVALITYMRTDSVRVAAEAQEATRALIHERFGAEYCPTTARQYKSKGSAQDAHEAIRPVDVRLTPEMVQPLLPAEQFKLYRLIWQRFVASQMASARFWDTTVILATGDAQWRAKGERLIFPGFLAVWPHQSDEAVLPKLTEGERVPVDRIHCEQKFTQPPARFTEASLVRKLEELGIGRPSTYATIISTLVDRGYVELTDKAFVPTDLGCTVSDLLVAHFTRLMDPGFTAALEADLDRIAEGETTLEEVLQRFAQDFYPTLEAARHDMATLKAGVETDIACPKCEHGKLIMRFGKNGPFVGCSNYPQCTFTSEYRRNDQGDIELLPQAEVPDLGPCPACQEGRLVMKKTRTGGRFVACSRYPDCRYATSLSTGVSCPREGCTGELVEKTTRRGKTFYSCNRYPECTYAVWDLPIPGPCPVCGFPILVRKITKAGTTVACPTQGCRYRSKEESGPA